MEGVRTRDNKHVLIRFFFNEQAYFREMELYQSGNITNLYVTLIDSDGPIVRSDETYDPAYIVTEKGLTLHEVIHEQDLTTP